METLQEKEVVKEFMKLLMENRSEMGQEYAAMLRQVGSMAGKLDAALVELREVKLTGYIILCETLRKIK